VARTVSCVETRRLQFCAVPEEADSRISKFLRSLRVPSAGLAATPGVRSMAPSKRRKTSAVSQPTSGNASSGVRTRRSTSAPGDLPSKDDGTRTFDDEGDVGVLRTWRAMCPELQERWPEAAQPEDWEGVDDGKRPGGGALELDSFGLTGALPAEIGQLTALR